MARPAVPSWRVLGTHIFSPKMILSSPHEWDEMARDDLHLAGKKSPLELALTIPPRKEVRSSNQLP